MIPRFKFELQWQKDGDFVPVNVKEFTSYNLKELYDKFFEYYGKPKRPDRRHGRFECVVDLESFEDLLIINLSENHVYSKDGPPTSIFYGKVNLNVKSPLPPEVYRVIKRQDGFEQERRTVWDEFEVSKKHS